MLFIPGELVGLATFPGIMVHELGHLLLCRIAGVKVKEWCLFRVKKPQGFVTYEKTESVFRNFLITFGPFFLNSALTVLLTLIFMQVKGVFPADAFFIWLAISIGAHAFPSTGDGKNLWNAAIESIKKRRVWNTVFLPFVAFIYIGAILSFFWIDFIYAGFLFVGTQAIFSAPIEFSEDEMSHRFENEVLSFNYPWNMLQESGKDYYKIKADLEESGYVLYFLSSQVDGAVVVFGAERAQDNVSLETYGQVIEALEYDSETYLVQKSMLTEIAGREWYEINAMDRSDPLDRVYKIEAITFCQRHKVIVIVVGNNFNTGLFWRIANSFKCKEEAITGLESERRRPAEPDTGTEDESLSGKANEEAKNYDSDYSETIVLPLGADVNAIIKQLSEGKSLKEIKEELGIE